MMSTHHKKYKLKGFSSWGKILWSSKKKKISKKSKNIFSKSWKVFHSKSLPLFGNDPGHLSSKLRPNPSTHCWVILSISFFDLKSLTYDLDLELWPMALKILSVLDHDPGHLSLKGCPNPSSRFWVIASTSCFYVSASGPKLADRAMNIAKQKIKMAKTLKVWYLWKKLKNSTNLYFLS